VIDYLSELSDKEQIFIDFDVILMGFGGMMALRPLLQ